MAILLALRSIVDHCDMEHSSKLELMQLQKPRVYILSDRQDLVGCIMIPTWSRKKNRDLWASFNWFSRYFDIKAAHIPRDTLHIHKQVDAIASNMRIVLKDFEKSQLESGNI
jgi:hypothetical protein